MSDNNWLSEYNQLDTRRISMEYAQVKTLPASIGKYTALRQLYLDHNQLTSLPESIGNLKNLEVFSVIGNKLKYLPKNFGNMKKLDYVYLSKNELTSLPESIGNLTNLDRLDLEENKLTSLPESIGNLTNLNYLFLSNNKLTSLPESIGNLKNLEFLYLDNNDLTSLPKSFKKLNSEIEIHYNRERPYTRDNFYSMFHKPRVSLNTEIINSSIIATNRITNIPKNKRVYVNKNSEYIGNTLRRVYNKNGINTAFGTKTAIRLHGDRFTKNNVRTGMTINKNVYLKNIKSRLLNGNVSLNNVMSSVNTIKNNLPNNVSKDDINSLVRSMKAQLLQKVFNKLKTSPSNNRMRLLNSFKSKGLINNNDISVMKKKLLGSNFVRNSTKGATPMTVTKRGGMNSNNVRKSPYI